MVKPSLPFKVGQYAEAKCFSPGFRGAWFRSKIRNIIGSGERMKLYLEYYDFPDEKMEWKKFYCKHSRYDTKEHLMVRPPYPPVTCEGELLDITNDSEVVVVVNDVWKEGDLVDWWTDGCHWSGKLKKKLTDKTFLIELLPEPEGEGSSYEAYCKDLRPSLVWSPERGWALPLPEGGKSASPCARLVHPKAYRGKSHSADEGRKGNPVTTEVREEHRLSKSSSSTGDVGCSGRFLTDQSRGMAGNCNGKDYRINEGPSKLARIHPVDESREGNRVAPKAQPEHEPSSSNSSKGNCPSSLPKDLQGGTASNHGGKDHQLVGKHSSKRARSEGNQVAPGTQLEHKPSSSSTSNGGWPSSFLNDPQLGTASNHDGKARHLIDEPSLNRATSEGITSNPKHSDTFAASILEVEELLGRVKWIKSILQGGSNSPKWTYAATE